MRTNLLSWWEELRDVELYIRDGPYSDAHTYAHISECRLVIRRLSMRRHACTSEAGLALERFETALATLRLMHSAGEMAHEYG